MIYLFVSRWKHTTKENTDTEKRDCRVMRQPLSLLHQNVIDLIENTKNEALKHERRIAYTSLFSALDKFFDVKDFTVVKNDFGKPILVSADGSLINDKIHISLSHSDGVAAVCISDEGEVGIDIQGVIDKEKEERLKGRFFTDLKLKNDDIEIKYYLCCLNENEAIFTENKAIKTECEGFTARWSYAESLMKLSGRGFGDINELENIAENTKSKIISLTIDKKYIVSISVK